MAIVQTTGFTSQLIGLSTDTKPTTNVLVGSIFQETDTKLKYIYNGSAWYVISAGFIIDKKTNIAVTAATNILTTYTAPASMQSTLVIESSLSGIVSLICDGFSASIDSGASLTAGTWYAFNIPLIEGSTYNLQFSVGATMQIKWVGGI